MEKATLRHPIQDYVLALCRAITSCKTLQRLLQLLQHAVSTLLEATEPDDQPISDEEGGDLAGGAAAVLAAAVAAGGGQRLVAHHFFSGPAFQDFSRVLLTVAAPQLLPQSSPEQRRQLFDVWYERAPAAAALLALTSHLSAVQPSAVPRRDGRTRVTAVAAEEAGALLAARFAAPGASGVQELVQLVADAAAAAAAPGALAGAPGADHQQQPQQQQQQQQQQLEQRQQAWQARSEALAAALASVPERAAALDLPSLQASAFVPSVAGRLLDLLAAESLSQAAQALRLEEQGGAPAAAAAAAQAAAAFAADVLSRLCRRGHQQGVATALLARLGGDGGRAADSAAACQVSAVLAAVQDSAALDRLLEAVLRVAASSAPRDAAASSPPLDAAPAADPAARAAADALAALVPPTLWRDRADARLLLTDKLLVAQQRRLLPLAALRGLLIFLRGQEPGGGGGGGPGSTPSGVLAAASATVARVWGDQAAVQRLGPQHQAFLTAALCGGLQLLEREELERHPELLQLLLAGITTRLDSPTQCVRRQAMRVGQALSALLDPSKPPIFAEDDAQLWQLEAEEAWDGAAPAAGTSQRAAAQQQQQQQQPPQQGISGRQGRREAREARRAARWRGAEAARQARRAAEAEGPLTETDSDDAGSDSDADSLSSSGSEGSASSGELQPYDLDESDEEDPAKSKLQLRDLPKMLLSKAEEDWRGQLRALRHAEYLIRAAPDELPAYAVPLARALIHTKVPPWMDQEMPEGGPPANTQRFRDVVSLLAGAPEKAGLALAAEMYGPSMDVFQRGMILDSMAAAAAELAQPGSALPPLPGLHPTPPPRLPAAAARSAEADAAAAAAAGLSPEQRRLLTTTLDGSKRVGRVTRIASRSLTAAARQAKPTHVNRFPPVALKWAAALLRHVDEPRHGIDLLGRDHFLLGKLLATLGSFLEASAQTTEAVTLAAATLELMRCSRVHAHPEAYVRRAALLAGGQVLGAVPPARLATAMLGAEAGGGSGFGGGGGATAADEALVPRLEWLRGWVEDVARQDTDASCRSMAEGVQKLQGNLAAGALAALDGGGQAGGALQGGSLLPLPEQGGSVRLPSGGLRLPGMRLP